MVAAIKIVDAADGCSEGAGWPQGFIPGTPVGIAGMGRSTAVRDQTKAMIQPSTVQPSRTLRTKIATVMPAHQRDERWREIQGHEDKQGFQHRRLDQDQCCVRRYGVGVEIGKES